MTRAYTQGSKENNGYTSTQLYEVQINPFHIEYAVVKSSSHQPQYNLGNNVIIQIYKENLLGSITGIKNMSAEVSINRCQIIRQATDADFSKKQILQKRALDTKTFFEDLFRRFQIAAKVVFIDFDINYYKTYCYIISERKINYLLLHETAVDSLKTRVAIKQIGIRDFARWIGGLGICGREQCCRSFLQNIQSVTLTMVRQQNIFNEPEKISGNCGKLRCCLMYEPRQCDQERSKQCSVVSTSIKDNKINNDELTSRKRE